MEVKNIYESIVACMNEIDFVGKNKKNDQGNGYKFRSIDDVVATCQTAMKKNGVFLTSSIISEKREERNNAKGTLIFTTITNYRFRFYALDGSFIDTEKQGEAMDTGDKGANKAYAAAEKYALCEVFMIPTYSGDDTENETYEVKAKQTVEEIFKPMFDNTSYEKFIIAKDIYMDSIQALEAIEKKYNISKEWQDKIKLLYKF